MTILRSRTASSDAYLVSNPAVDRTRAEVEARRLEDLALARQSAATEARAAALAECEARIRAAETRATTAEAEAKQAVASAEAELDQRLGQVLRALEAGVAHLSGLERQLVEEAEADVVRLAMRVAARILRREVEDDPEWLEPILREALGLVPDKRGVAVRLHPEDAAVARERKAALLADVPGLERLEVFEDPALARGTCLVASQGTRVDASVPTTWERLFRELAAAAPPPALRAGGNESGENDE